MEPKKTNAPRGASRRGADSKRVVEPDRITLPATEQRGQRLAPFFREVADAVADGRAPNVWLYAGRGAWERAQARRRTHGPETALVLPTGTDPLALKWPAVDSVMVLWPGHDSFDRKLALAQALVRDGIRVAQIQHAPEWIHARRKAA